MAPQVQGLTSRSEVSVCQNKAKVSVIKRVTLRQMHIGVGVIQLRSPHSLYSDQQWRRSFQNPVLGHPFLIDARVRQSKERTNTRGLRVRSRGHTPFRSGSSPIYPSLRPTTRLTLPRRPRTRLRNTHFKPLRPMTLP